MRCEECDGKGWVPFKAEGFVVRMPCMACLGDGVAHCCDGLRAQPDEEGAEE